MRTMPMVAKYKPHVLNAALKRDARLPGYAGGAKLGLMGKRITTCFLSPGQAVACLESSPSKLWSGRKHIPPTLKEMRDDGLLKVDLLQAISKFRLARNFELFGDCETVVEPIAGDLPAKQEALARVEEIELLRRHWWPVIHRASQSLICKDTDNTPRVLSAG